MRLLSAMVVLLVALPLVLCSGVYAKGKKELLKPGEKININSASKAELMKLPSVGEKRAEKIMSRRPYTNAEDLKAKKVGVGEKTLEKWGDHITFDEAAPAAVEEVKSEPEAKTETKKEAPEATKE